MSLPSKVFQVFVRVAQFQSGMAVPHVGARLSCRKSFDNFAPDELESCGNCLQGIDFFGDSDVDLGE